MSSLIQFKRGEKHLKTLLFISFFYIIRSMVRKTKFFFILFAVFGLFISESFAESESGTLIKHHADLIFNENISIAAQTFETEAVYNRDLILIAEDALFNGYVEGDFLGAAKNLEIRGEIEGDLRVIGGTVVLNGYVHGDILVFGGSVTATSSSMVLGDAIVMGGKFTHDGTIQDDLQVISAVVSLGGELADDITITTQDLIVKEDVMLSESAEYKYYAPREAQIPESLQETFEYAQTSLWYRTSDFQSTASVLFGFWSLLKFFTSAVLIFLFYFVFRSFIERVKDQGSQQWLKSGIVGAIALVALPTVSLLLMVSLIGLPIGLLTLLLFWSLLILRVTLASFVISVWLPTLYKKLTKKTYRETRYGPVLWAFIGLALLIMIGYIPYIGILVVNGFSLIAFGATLIILYKSIFRRS